MADPSFDHYRQQLIGKMRIDTELADIAKSYLLKVGGTQDYLIDWLGIPIIQTPEDIIRLQMAIYKCKPNVIIETGIARGGSLAFTCTILHLINYASPYQVIGVDIDIRQHTRDALDGFALKNNISLIQGSSVDPRTKAQVLSEINVPNPRIMVILDSNHTHQHVLDELRLFSDLVSVGCYLVVADTGIELRPHGFYQNRNWGPGNSPMSAMHEFLSEQNIFTTDDELDAVFQITASPHGYLFKSFSS